MALLTLVCVSISLLSLWLRPVWLALVGLVLVAALAAASYEAYTRGGYWLDFLAPLIGMLVFSRAPTCCAAAGCARRSAST